MYTLRLSNDKSLIPVFTNSIYQFENNTTTIDIFIPYYLDNINLQEYELYIDYLLPNGHSGNLKLEKEESIYNNYDLYKYHINNFFTVYSGRVKFWVRLLKNNSMLRSSESYFDVIPSIDVSMSQNKLQEIFDRLKALEDNKADNITIDNNNIQLQANNQPIGDTIQINKLIDLDVNGGE